MPVIAYDTGVWRRVRGQHPLLISKAFEVGTVHFGPRLLAFAAFQKMICVETLGRGRHFVG